MPEISYDNPETSEGWAWDRIKRGEKADFNFRCGTTQLDSCASDESSEKSWQDDRRRLSASFLVDVLTKATLRDQVQLGGIHIIGACIVGDINLRNTLLNREFSIEQSRIGGKVDLHGARTDSDLSFAGSRLAGTLSASQLRDEQSITLNGATFEQEVTFARAKIDRNVNMIGAKFESNLNADSLQVGSHLLMRSGASFKGVILRGAKVAGNVDMDGATFGGDLNADSMQVDASLFMRNGASFKGVILRATKVAGQVAMVGGRFDGDLDADSLQVGSYLLMRSTPQNKTSFKSVRLLRATVASNVEMDGATFGGDLNAVSLQVGSHLLMRNGASFKGVILRGAKVAGNVEMDGATFDGYLYADAMQVDVSLFMRNGAHFKSVNLGSAKVAGNVEMDGAAFDGDLKADSLRVGGHLFMRNAVYTQKVNAVFAKIDGNLDLNGATLAGLDLSGALVMGEFRVGFRDQSHPSTVWSTKEGAPGDLSLRHTRIGSLLDTRDAWPQSGHLQLDGFSFARLGGFKQQQESEARRRGAEWWDEWARRDSHYSPHVYQQLAAAFTAAGDRNLADEIRYLGQVREHETLTGWSWVWFGLLRWVAGFGVGSYPFRVLYWVAGISLAGALYLLTCSKGVQNGDHGFVWCWGASLARLLPVIEINKEFTDFFNDPKRERLTDFQTFVFSFIGVLGWFLAAVLVAAVSGVTKRT